MKRKELLIILLLLALLALFYFYSLSSNQDLGFFFNGREYLFLNKSVNGNFTVVLWAKYTYFNGTGVLISDGIGENEHSIWYVGTGGEIPGVTSCGVFSDQKVGNYTAGWRFASVPFVGVGKEVQIACVYNTTDVAIYLDGRLMNVTPTPYKVYNGSVMELGKRTSTFYFNATIPSFAYFTGYLANVQVYARPLSGKEIAELYEEGVRAKPLSGVVAYFPLLNNSLACVFNSIPCQLQKRS